MDDTGRYVIALQNIHNVTRESTKGTKKDRFVITVYMNVRKLILIFLDPLSCSLLYPWTGYSVKF